jgi:tRNA nucleotidyltransferase (CCA-adding enzyme)
MPNLLDLFCKYAVAHGLAEDSFIVGGAVRDLLLNKDIRDLDIAVNRDSLATGRAFADEINATFVLLDKEFGVARIAFFSEYLDICPVRHGSITEDLGERDLTINAMAIPLSGYLRLKPEEGIRRLKAEIIDPFDGMGALEKGVIRMVSEKNLAGDPLRLLRVYRFAAALGFSIDPPTSAAVARLRHLIGSSAAERITGELRHILECNNSAPICNAMNASGLLQEIFPTMAGNVWHDVYASYSCAEGMLSDPALYFGDRSVPVEEYFSTGYRRECLKLSILMGDCKSAKNIFTRLRLSRKEIEFIRLIDSYNPLISSLDVTGSSVVMALLRELKDNLYAILVYILSLDSVLPSAGSAVGSLVNHLIAIYQDEYIPRTKILPLLNGYDLMNQFDLSPSVFFRDILSAIELLALEGKISTREEALRVAGGMIKGKSLMGDL